MNKLRFAPSPTGNLHVGNFRTALINYLLAKKLSGHFMLRIDDTDIERSNLIYEEQIKKDLVWAGMNWDSEVKQSQRINKYKEVLDLLISKQLVYPCFEDPEELNLKRKALLSSGKPPIYDRKSLNLTDKEIEEKISNGKKPHYRFFLKSEKIIWNDLVRGECVLDTSSVSDPIIVREDGRFIYTLASVIDDSDFKITHIIRGEDHVTNSAVQIQIFKALNSQIPQMGHLSLMTDIDGGGLSKRIGSLSIDELKKQNIEPQALTSYLAKIGSSQNVELHNSINQLINEFEINAFNRAPTKFDHEFLKNFNIKFFQLINFNTIKERITENKTYFTEEFWDFIKTNVSSIDQIHEWLDILYGNFYIDKNNNFETKNFYLNCFPDQPIDHLTWSKWLENITLKVNDKKINIIKNIRAFLTGKSSGPELSSLIIFLGKEKIFQRLKTDN